MRLIHCFLILVSFGPGFVHAAAKKLIEFGWDEPDTRYLKEHIAQMEKMPFDGCVFHIKYTKTNGTGRGDFMWEGWGKRAFHEVELKAALDELKATKFKRF